MCKCLLVKFVFVRFLFFFCHLGLPFLLVNKDLQLLISKKRINLTSACHIILCADDGNYADGSARMLVS